MVKDCSCSSHVGMCQTSAACETHPSLTTHPMGWFLPDPAAHWDGCTLEGISLLLWSLAIWSSSFG